MLLLQAGAAFLPAAEAAAIENAVHRAAFTANPQIVASAGASVRMYNAGEASPASSAAVSPPSTTGDSLPPARAPPPSGLLLEKGMLADDALLVESQTPSGEVASLAHGAALDLALATHRRELQVTVSDVTDLINKLADPSVSRIVVAPGHYALTAELSVSRAVTIEAAVPGSVVLDAQASSSVKRRVLNVNPAPSDAVELIGLNVTGGYVSYPDYGGGIQISNGQVTLSQVNVYSNTASVSARLLNPP